MLEELRNKLSQMFIDSIQPYIRGEMDTPEKRANFYKNSFGIFGAQDQRRETIKEGKQENTLVQSALRANEKAKKRKLRNPYLEEARLRKKARYENPGYPRRKRERARSPLPPPASRDRSPRPASPPRKRRAPKALPAAAAGSSRDAPWDATRIPRNQSEYFSPKSFVQAWGEGFFSSVAILMVTAVGLIVDNLPSLHNLPIGGRLVCCVSS